MLTPARRCRPHQGTTLGPRLVYANSRAALPTPTRVIVNGSSPAAAAHPVGCSVAAPGQGVRPVVVVFNAAASSTAGCGANAVRAVGSARSFVNVSVALRCSPSAPGPALASTTLVLR